MNTQEFKKLKEELFEIIALIPAINEGCELKKEIEKDKKRVLETIKEDELGESRERVLDIVNELKDHFNSINYYPCTKNNRQMTALDFVIFFDTQGYGSDNATRINNKTLLKLENAIRDEGGKTSEELGRVSNLNNGSGSESELSSNEESEDEDIVVDHQARSEYQTLQQNINSAKSCSVFSTISFIATTGILAGRILSSIEHEEESELISFPVLFLSCLNFLSLGLIFDSNRVIRSNQNQINSLLENTADQQVIPQAQNR